MGFSQHLFRSTCTIIGVLLMTSALSSCSATNQNKPEPSVRQMLAQKLMLDIRYFCEPEQLKRYKGRVSCHQNVSNLPPEIGKLISDHSLGGVILFAENFSTIEQATTLVHELQQAAAKSELAQPLFISVDQEGGRVARLPRQWSTPMTGNMSIGATFPKFGSKYAKLSGQVLATELSALGVNVNHGPTVDVNVNPKNPVINIRSFGESAEQVAELGTEQAKAMQENGVIATLKHFPGHGDTHVDSHTGLPRVDHDFEKVKAVDLLPFQQAIDAGVAKMIMTAHIQYPHLDDSTFVSTEGKTMVKPATMSRAILTDLLREQMQFEGVVITDALDMAGISEFFNEQEAVIETFKAGADIALMPIKIRSIEDLHRLPELLDKLELAVKTGELDDAEVAASYQRIEALKTQFAIEEFAQQDLNSKLNQAHEALASSQSKAIETELAQASITLIKGQGVLAKEIQKLHLVMPDNTKCSALMSALLRERPDLTITCASSYTESGKTHQDYIRNADAVLLANITPKQSAVELGGMEDLQRFKQSSSSKWQQDKLLEQLLQFAKAQNKPTWFVALRTPYEAQRYGALSDNFIATYGYNAHVVGDGKNAVATGPVYDALARLLVGELKTTGQSPVTVKLQ